MVTPFTPSGAAPDVLTGAESERELLDAAASGVAARRSAEVAELLTALAWADRHGHPVDERDQMTTPGGDGTPSVREVLLPELAMARGEHTLRTRSMLADALDLAHRLPLTWARVVAVECEPWVARRVAVLARKVMAADVGIVDRAVARAIATHAPSTVFEITAAKVIEADPEAHRMERERQRHERYVALSKPDAMGFRCVIAKVTAGDAAWVDAMVDRVADILGLTMGDDHNHDELRALAFGWLARPADLLKLLLDHTEPDESIPPAWAAGHMLRTVERLAAMSTRQLASLRGRCTLFVHLTDRALRDSSGVARVEGVGPLSVEHLTDVLGHADIAVKPVIDHRIRHRSDAYEHTDLVKDHVWTQTGGDVFPFAPRTATREQVDFDHAQPYSCTGPPGQTGPHNSGPLRRSHHRWKTHGRYRVRQTGPGRHLWQTPHGLCFLVDAEGTRRLNDEEADMILNAPPGVDVYPGALIAVADTYLH